MGVTDDGVMGSADDEKPVSMRDVHDAVEALFREPVTPAIGLEIELLTYPEHDPGTRSSLEALAQACSVPLSGGSSFSIEPGGQLEVSTPPCESADDLREVLRADLGTAEQSLRNVGIRPAWDALDRSRRPIRIREDDRYRFMEQHFDLRGPAGRWMMNNTAAMQLNLSPPDTPVRAWRLLSNLAPILSAAFANSSGRCCHGQRWTSLRQACWLCIDPSRTRALRAEVDPVPEYFEFVLDADVLLINGAQGAVPAPRGLRFGHWVLNGLGPRRVTRADLEYHLTTLFPPVRPRGWFELRTIDATRREHVDVVAALGTALLDAAVIDELLARELGTSEAGAVAARHGMSCPKLALGARILFDVVEDALRDRDPVGSDAVAAYRESRLFHPNFEPTTVYSPTLVNCQSETAGSGTIDLATRGRPAASSTAASIAVAPSS